MDEIDVKIDDVQKETMVTIKIGTSQSLINSSSLKQLSYFEARLSQRWRNKQQDVGDDIIVLCDVVNEDIGFQFEQIQTLLSIKLLKQNKIETGSSPFVITWLTYATHTCCTLLSQMQYQTKNR